MRIVYCINDLKTGGTERQLVALANAMACRGHEVTVARICPRGELAENLDASVKLFDLNIHRLFNIMNIFSVLRFIWFLIQYRPHILQSFLFNPNMLCRICGFIVRVPLVISSQRSTDMWRRSFHISADRLSAPLAHCVLSNSYSAAEILQKREKIPPEKIAVIPNGLVSPVKGNASVFKKRYMLENTFVIGTAGRICEAKGQDILIRSCADILRLKDAVLVIAGQGDTGNLKKLAAELGVEKKVIFTGNVSDIENYIAGFDLFVLSSRWEGFPNVLLEALHQNVSVISTDCGDARKIVGAERVCAPDNPEALRELIEKAISRQLPYPEKTDYSFEKSVIQTEKIYRKYVRFKKRILHVITLSEPGGATENTLISVKGLAQNYHVAVAAKKCEKDRLFQECEKAGIATIELKHMNREISPFEDIRAIAELWRIIRAGNYTVVHTHSSKAGIIGRIAAFLARTPYIVHTVHGLPFHRFQPVSLHFMYVAAEVIAGFFTHMHITVAEQVKDKSVKYHLNTAERITVIRSSVDFNKFRNEKNAVYPFPAVGMLGRLVPLKGVEYFIRLIAGLKEYYPDISGILIGDGPLKEKLKRYSAELGITENIVFRGHCSDVGKELSTLDVLVHTSLLEGLPRSVIEGFLADVPVAAFCVDATAEALGFGMRGACVRVCDEEMLLRKVHDILKNPGKYQKKSRAAKKWVYNNYSPEKMVDAIDRVYKKLAGWN